MKREKPFSRKPELRAKVKKSDWKPSILNTEVVHYPADSREDFWIREERREKALTETLDKISHDQAKKGATLIFCRSKNKCFKQAIALSRKLTGDTNFLEDADTNNLQTMKKVNYSITTKLASITTDTSRAINL